jgi:hypothetical protein
MKTIFSDLSEAGNTLPIFSKVFKGSINVHSDLLTQSMSTKTSQGPHNTTKAREKPNKLAKTREVVVALSTISKKFCG